MSQHRSLRSTSKYNRRSRRSREHARNLLFEQLETRALLTAVAGIENLNNFNITGNVGEKPESKIWEYGGDWFGVFSDSIGSHVYRLDGANWTKTYQISADTHIKVDAKVDGDVVHVFFENDLESKLYSIQYVSGALPTYELWDDRPTASDVPLAEETEAATIDIDSTGRMWVSYDEQDTKIQVRYSDAPYDTWSEPIIIADNVFKDDLSVVTALPNGTIGVMWANQATERFGFRTHVDGTDPTEWTEDELPGSQTAVDDVGRGFADDHINLAVASDATLYAAVKTGYDDVGYPIVGLLVRRPNGVWDDFHEVVLATSAGGGATRAAVQLNELKDTLIVSYDDDVNWAYRECSTVTLACTDATILLDQGKNATSTKQNVTNDLVLLTSGKSTGGNVHGVRFTFDVPNAAPVVDAGDNQVIFAGQPATVRGIVDDDGLPSPSNVTATWSKFSGPGDVTFDDASSHRTTATFSQEGVYILQLAASDGEFTTSDTVAITVGTPPPNTAPTVDVGADLVIGIAQSPLLEASVIDDGQPFDPGAVTMQWTQVDGPGTTTFGNANAANTTVTFSEIGIYTLRLTASDSELEGTDDVIVTVNLLPPNEAPFVSAGENQTIVVNQTAQLDGTVIDDEQPVPQESLDTSWSKVSGPGDVLFLNASSVDTSAFFSAPGTYVLRLTADDTELIGSATVTITVEGAAAGDISSFQDEVLPSPAYNGARDTKFRSDNENTNYGTTKKLEIDGNPDFTSLLKWDVSSIPSSANVVGASFTVNVVNDTIDTFQVYPLLRDWIESEATFLRSASGVPWEVPGAAGATDRGSTSLGTITAESVGLVTVTLNAAGIDVVQSWVSDPANNFGLILQDFTNDFTDDLDFESRETSTPSNRPRLDITYSSDAVNDPPFIANLEDDFLHYIDGSGQQLLDQGTLAATSDSDSPDYEGGSLTVSIASGGEAEQDVLAIQNLGDISVDGADVKHAGNVIGTVSGGTNGADLVVEFNALATPAIVGQLISAVSYANLSSLPSETDRVVTFTLNDGDGAANGGNDTRTVTTTVGVTAVNNAPEITDLDQDVLEYFENSGPQFIDQAPVPGVADPDSLNFRNGSLVVSLGATGLAEDTLSILDRELIDLVGMDVRYDEATFGLVSGGTEGSDLVISFNLSADSIAVAALLSAITYENNSENPDTTPRLVTFTLNDGDGTDNGGTDTATASATVNVTSINDAPLISELAGDTLAYSEGSGPQPIDQGTLVTLQDVDSLDFDGGAIVASFTGTGFDDQDILSIQDTADIVLSGTEVKYQGTTIGSVSGGAGGADLVVDLNDASTSTAVSSLLSAITYENSSPLPGTSQRTVTISLNDGDGTDAGGIDSTSATTTINVTSINAAPIVSELDGETLFYGESTGPQPLDQGPVATVTDADSLDFDGGSLTIAFVAGNVATEDVLSIATSGDITFDGSTVTYLGTPIGAATGGSAGADLVVTLNSSTTPAATTALIGALRYENTSELPSTEQRVIELSLVDGDGTENGGTDTTLSAVTIDVASINDAPVLVNLDGDESSYTENDPAHTIDQGDVPSISDVDSLDFDGGALTVSVLSSSASSGDVLSIQSAGDIGVDGNSVTYQGAEIGISSGGAEGTDLTITLNAAASQAAVAELIHSIMYENVSDAPSSGPRLVTFTVIDGDGTENGGVDAVTATATINLIAVNDPPVFVGLDGGNSYTEGGAAIRIDSDATILDAELSGADDHAGASLIIFREGGQNADDHFSFDTSGSPNFTVGAGVLEAGGQAFATFASVPGSLSIQFSGGSTTSLVNEVFQRISYADAGDVMPGSVTLSYSISDGNANDAQGLGENPGTGTGTAVVMINTLPAFNNLDGGNMYYEDGPAVLVDFDVQITDQELDALDNYEGASLTVARQGGANLDDILGLDAASVVVSGSDVRVGLDVVATLTQGPGDILALTFNANASAAIAQQVVQAVTYASTTENPPADVTLEYIINDGNVSVSSTAVISITSVNDAPVIDHFDTFDYLENAGPQIIDRDAPVMVTDVDSVDFDGGSLTVSFQSGGALLEDVLSFDTSGAIAFDGSVVSYLGTEIGTAVGGSNGNDLVISLNATATPTSMSELLGAITYENTSESPSVAQRVVVFSLTDGDGVEFNGSDTGLATATINILSVNDAPQIAGLDGDIFSYTENDGAQAIDRSAAAALSDVDSPDFATGSLTVSISSGGVGIEDRLSIQNAGLIGFDGTSVTHGGVQVATALGGSDGVDLEISFNNSATSSAVAALLNAIVYENVSDAPTTSERLVTFTLTDGDGTDNGGVDVAAATTTIHVIAVNDAPVFVNLDGDGTLTEGSSPVRIDTNGTIFDAELSMLDDHAGASLAIFRDGGINTDDVFSFDTSGTPGFTVGTGELKAAGQSFATFINGLGLLTLQFSNGSTTALVNEVLQRLRYFNTATELPDSVTLRYSINDGNDSNAQGTGDNPGVGTATATVAINKLPSFTNLNGGEVYVEDGPAVLVDTDALISDLERDTQGHYDGVSLSVKRQGAAHPDDLISLNSGSVSLFGLDVVVGGNFVANLSQGPGNEIFLTFNANATPAIADQVLQAVTYANVSQNPPTTVTLSYTAIDGGSAKSTTAVVNITPVNDAPVIDHLSTLEYFENSGAQVIDQGDPATASDVDSLDFANGSLVVSFESGSTASEDVLSVQSQGNISFDGTSVHHLGTAIGTANGGSNGVDLVVTFNSFATLAAVSDLLGAVTYANTSHAPSMSQRLVEFSLNDGDGVANDGFDTAVTTATINITPVNDAPVLVNLSGDVLPYPENSGPRLIDQGASASVTDVDSLDFDSGTLAVSVSSGGVAPDDVLSIQSGGSIGFDGTSVTFQATEIGTAVGGSNGEDLVVTFNASATPAAVGALLSAITYENLSDGPSTAERVVTFTFVDGDGSDNNGDDTTVAMTTINISAVNDTPAFVDLDGGNTFTEGGAPVRVDTDATITDAELDVLNNYAGAALTVVRDGGQSLDDRFGFDMSGTPGFTLGSGVLKFEGQTFATFSHTLGFFAIGFQSTETPATTELVNQVLQRITYRNVASVLPSSVTLLFTLSDGNSGSQGTGNAPGTDVGRPIVKINTVPAFENLNGGGNYTEIGPAALVDLDVAVYDLELDAADNFDGASLTVTRQGGPHVDDVIGLGSATVTVTGADIVVGGVVVGTLLEGPGTSLSLALNGSATSAIADQVLRAVNYINVNGSPPSTVTLQYTFDDGFVATTGTATVSIDAVNSAPTISNLAGDDLTYRVLAFTGNAPPQIIDQGDVAIVSDADSLDFAGGTVTAEITTGGVAGEDVLSIHNAGSGAGEIGFDGTTVTYEGAFLGTASGGSGGAPLVVQLSPTASIEGASALLGAMTYENLSANPDLAQRTVVFSVKDGDGTDFGGIDTGTVEAIVSLRPVNDPPAIFDLDGDTLEYTETAGAQIIDDGVVVSVVDNDSPVFDGGTLRVVITSGSVPEEDHLLVANNGDIAVVASDIQHLGTTVGTFTGGSNGEDLVISFNVSATVAAVADVLASIAYENMSTAPNATSRQVEFTLNDGDGTLLGGHDTTSATAFINFTALNDPPVLSNFDGGGVFSNGAGAVLVDGDATVIDVELQSQNNYAGATITLVRDRGANPDDSFGFNAAPSFTVDGGELKSGGLTFATWTDVDGTLTVNLTSAETPATGALVNEVLQHINYRNLSAVLPSSVRLLLSFSDGNSDNEQGLGENPAITTAIATLQVDQAPVLAGFTGITGYVENGPAILVDQGVYVADSEMDSLNDYSGASFTVVRQGGADVGDIISLGSAHVTLQGTDVTVGAVIVATVTQGPGSELSVTFNSNSTSADADHVLRAVTYAHIGDTPQANIVLEYRFNDGIGQTIATKTVSLASANDAPVLTLTSALTYTEGSGPQRIDHADSTLISDVDSPDFAGGSFTVSITSGGVAAEDVLSIQHTGDNIGEIGFDGTTVRFEGTLLGTATGGTNGEAIVVLLNDSANSTSVAALMRAIAYENTSNNPDPTQRVVSFALNDGDGNENGGSDTGSVTAPIDFVLVNDPPVILDLDGDGLAYTENVGPLLLDMGIAATVSDVDSFDFESGSLTVSFVSGAVPTEDALSVQSNGDIAVAGTSVTFQGTSIGTVTGGTNGDSLSVALKGSATIEAVSALLQSVAYANLSETPTQDARTILFQLHDGDSVDGIGEATTQVEFTAVNDAPVILDLTGDTLTYTENAGLSLFDVGTLATVQDVDSPDFAGGTLTLSFSSGGVPTEDNLIVLSAGDILFDGTNVSHLGTPIGTAAGGGNGADLVVNLNAFATPSAVSSLLNAIAYQNTSDAPSAVQRIVSVTLVDGDGVESGGADTGTATTTINVVPVNDPPAMDALDGDVLSYTENAGLQLVDQETVVSISDLDSADFDTGSLTVSITTGLVATEDVLGIAAGGAITVDGADVLHSGTVIGTVAGGANGSDLVVTLNSGATQAAVAALVGAVAYENSSDSPQLASREVTLTLNDGDGIENGGVDFAVATVTIDVTPINDAPVFNDLDGDSQSYTEGAGTVRFDQGVAASVSDSDSLDFADGSLTVSFALGGVPTEDILSVLPGGDITLDGSDVQFQGTVLGTLTGGSDGVPLAISLAPVATPTSVSALLGAIAYTNISLAPSIQSRTVVFTLNDGDGVENGGVDTASATTTISVAGINAAPVIGELDGDASIYLENALPQLIDQGLGATVTDVDSADFDGGSLTVAFESGSIPAEDSLSIQNTGTELGQIGFDGSSVTYESVVIGTAAGGSNGAALVVSLNSFATQPAVAALLGAITFASISENPDATARVVSFTLSDGDGTDGGGADTTSVTAEVSMTAVNDAPAILNLGGDDFSYAENAGPVVIDQALAATIESLDSPDFDGGSLTVSFTSGGVAAEDVLAIATVGNIESDGTNVSHSGTVIGSVTGGTNGADLVVVLNSFATPTSVSDLLNAITYENTSLTPTAAARIVSFSLNDGDGIAEGGSDTSSVSVTISMLPVNAPPVLKNLDADNLVYPENNGVQRIDQGVAASLSDNDSLDFDGGSLIVTFESGGVPGEDVLSIQSIGNISFDGSSVTYQGTEIGAAGSGHGDTNLVIDLNAFATPTTVAALLNAIAYENASETPSIVERVVTFSLNDGDGIENGGVDTSSVSVTIQVIAVNDLPAFADLNGGNTFNEGGSPVRIDPDVTMSDAELDAVNDYAGGVLTIARDGGANADDLLGLDSSGSPSFTIGSSVLQIGGQTFATFTNASGELAIQFTSGSTTALVNEVLQRVTYANVGAAIPPSVALSYTIEDGNSGDAQGTGSNPGTDTGIVTVAINKPPELSNLDGGALYVERGLAVLVDSDAVVSDIGLDALNNYEGASLTVARQGGEQAVDLISLESATVAILGSNVTVSGNPVATLSQGPGSTLSLIFNEHATSTIADQVLQAVTYASSEQNPPETITLEYIFSDGIGSVPQAATVNILPVNDAPAIDHLSTLTYQENSGPQIIDGETPATATDVDSPNFAGGSLTVSIATGGVAVEDVLSIQAVGDIGFDGVNVSHGGSDFGTVSGGSSGADLAINFNTLATPAIVSDLLRAISYENTSEAPSSAQRLVTFTLIDGDGDANGGFDSTVTTSTINVSPVNDAPTLTNLSGDALTYVEGTTAQRIDQQPAAAVADIDSLNFGGGSLTVSLSGSVAAEDVLSVDPGGGITVNGVDVSYLGTLIANLSGGAGGTDLVMQFNTAATPTAVSALLNAIAYENVSIAPTTSLRTVTFTMNDGDGVADGGIATTFATATIAISAVNDAPTIADLEGDTLAYVEGTGAQLVDQGAAASLTDPDSLNFEDGSLTVSLSAGHVPTEDVLSIASSGDITVAGSAIEFQSTTIGTVSGGTAGSDLVVALNSSANAASVTALLNAIAYENTSDAPNEGSRTATITFVDGDGGTDTATAMIAVSVTPTNDAPVFSGLTGDTLVYVEQSGGQVLDQGSGASISDVDSPDFGGGSLTVEVTVGAAPSEDVLSIQDGATIGFDGTTVTHGGTTIGTATGGDNGTPLVISLTTAATPTTVSSLIGSLTYENLSISPNLAPRTVTVTLDDGDGTDNGGQNTGVATTTVNISPINAAPTITGLNNDVLSYVEGTGSKSIDQGTAASIADVDSPNFDGGSLTVSITANGVAAEDVLSIRTTGDISVSGSNVRYQGTVIGTAIGGANATDLVVSLNSSATLPAVSSLLSAVGYTNTSITPSESPRTVAFTIDDGDGTDNGGASTATATTTINVTAVSDPISISFQEGVFPTSGYSGTRDAPVRGDDADKNFGTRSTLWLDGNPDQTSLIRWEVSSIPLGSVVQSATITVNVVNTSEDTFSIYKMLVPWVESQVTFNERSAGTPWEVEGAAGASDRGSTVLGTITGPTLGQRVITLNSAGIQAIQSWIDNPNENHGIAFQNFENGSTDDLDFNSSEGSNALSRPKLTVSYLPPAGSNANGFTQSKLRNEDNPFDVNADKQVSPLDALVVINSLSGSVEGEAINQAPTFYLDVSGDGSVSPLDALLVINFLNQPGSPLIEEGEGGSGADLLSAATSIVVTPLTTLPPDQSMYGVSDATPTSSLSGSDAIEDLRRLSAGTEDATTAVAHALATELESTLDAVCDDLLARSVAEQLASDDPRSDFFAEFTIEPYEDESG